MDDPKFPRGEPETAIETALAAKIDRLYRQLDELGSDADTIYRRESSDAVAGAALITRALRISSTINLATLEERVASEARFERSRELDRQAIGGVVGDGLGELGESIATLWRIARRIPGWREAELAELAETERADVPEG